MAFEFQEPTIVSICVDCVYFNAYGRLDDTTMANDRNAAEKHKQNIAANGWKWGTEFTPGCGKECPEHGIAAYDSAEAYEQAQLEDSAESEPWFSWSACEQCGSTLGGDREHATAWEYKEPE
jgi:hypothetical protein